MKIPEFNERNYQLAGYIATGIVTISALFLCYEVLFCGDLTFKAQWNIFKSPLLGPLFIVGLVLAIMHMGNNHYSYDTYEQIEYSDGTKSKPKKSYDVIDNIEGGCLAPLFGHFLLEPFFYACLIYYPLMCLVAFVGSIFPYVLSVVVLALCVFVFKFSSLFQFRYHSVALVALSVVLTASFTLGGLAIMDGEKASTPENATSQENSEFEENTEFEESTPDETTKTEDKIIAGDGDLPLHNLYGPVKSCHLDYGNGGYTDYTFDLEGRWQTLDGKEMSSLCSVRNRDDKNRLIKTIMEEYQMEITTKYTYNADGLLEKEASTQTDGDSNITYVYDAKGRVIKQTLVSDYVEMGAEERVKNTTVTTYTYQDADMDSHGNWTKRIAQSENEKLTETRKITYYK